MKIEVGKYYKTRNGRKVGPICRTNQKLTDPWPFVCDYDDSVTGRMYIRTNGETQNGLGDPTTPNIISEWHDGPVSTVTRKEIVPGVYGTVKVHDPGVKYVRINMDAAMGISELRAAAATLIEIADALEDGKDE